MSFSIIKSAGGVLQVPFTVDTNTRYFQSHDLPDGVRPVKLMIPLQNPISSNIQVMQKRYILAAVDPSNGHVPIVPQQSRRDIRTPSTMPDPSQASSPAPQPETQPQRSEGRIPGIAQREMLASPEQHSVPVSAPLLVTAPLLPEAQDSHGLDQRQDSLSGPPGVPLGMSQPETPAAAYSSPSQCSPEAQIGVQHGQVQPLQRHSTRPSGPSQPLRADTRPWYPSRMEPNPAELPATRHGQALLPPVIHRTLREAIDGADLERAVSQVPMLSNNALRMVDDMMATIPARLPQDPGSSAAAQAPAPGTVTQPRGGGNLYGHAGSRFARHDRHVYAKPVEGAAEHLYLQSLMSYRPALSDAAIAGHFNTLCWQNLSCHRDPLVQPKSAAHIAEARIAYTTTVAHHAAMQRPVVPQQGTVLAEQATGLMAAPFQAAQTTMTPPATGMQHEANQLVKRRRLRATNKCNICKQPVNGHPRHPINGHFICPSTGVCPHGCCSSAR
eukprot:scaffold667291_cov107-Prasinocladus_malaysianus.AAC.1